MIVETIVSDPTVRKVNFTGSAATGRKVATACAKNLKPCLMELGGKNSSIVFEDADLEKAVKACIAGAFLNVSNNGTQIQVKGLTSSLGRPNMHGNRPHPNSVHHRSQIFGGA